MHFEKVPGFRWMLFSGSLIRKWICGGIFTFSWIFVKRGKFSVDLETMLNPNYDPDYCFSFDKFDNFFVSGLSKIIKHNQCFITLHCNATKIGRCLPPPTSLTMAMAVAMAMAMAPDGIRKVHEHRLMNLNWEN